MATQEEVKQLIAKSKSIWAEVKELERQHIEKHREYGRVMADLGKAAAAFRYGVAIGDVISSKKSWGLKSGKEFTIKVDRFSAYSPGDSEALVVHFEGYLLKKDGSIGQRRATIYPDEGFTVVSKATE